ncbi:MAG: cytochrome-c peroxidase, partial [Bacteroidia bacterium]
MKKIFGYLLLSFSILLFLSFRSGSLAEGDAFAIDSLRKLYSGPVSGWPKPNVDAGVNYQELGILPPSPLNLKDEVVKRM